MIEEEEEEESEEDEEEEDSDTVQPPPSTQPPPRRPSSNSRDPYRQPRDRPHRGGGEECQDQGTTPGPTQDEDDDMEDMIADDAVWKRIQQNTFTRWANEHLKTVHQSVLSLETDLDDGLRLIALLQVLSGKTLPKHTKKPNFRSQKLENVSVALNFLEKDEGIKIVNIDSSDIVDCKLKLILGLIWHLILHYSISMPVWEGEDSLLPPQGEKDKKGPTPKQRLLNWVQNKVPEVSISNFTSDWKDGRAVGALVDAVAPGLCPDWPDWDPNQALQNATEAMGLADDYLDIRQLIKPEEIINPNMDELSMMTYLSQYPSAKLKPGAPLRQRTHPDRVRCYGPGLEPSGIVLNAPALFTVETFAGGKGEVEVRVENPAGQLEPVEVTFKNDRNLNYACSYTPSLEGTHKVGVLYGQPGRFIHVPGSPFSVVVEGKGGDAGKVEVRGPGLEPQGLLIGKQTYFDIFTTHAGRGVPEVVVVGPDGKPTPSPVRLRQLSGEVWRAEYSGATAGHHSVNVFFNRDHIPKSPFPVNISPISDPKRVRASGRGLQGKGVRVGDQTATFKVLTEGAGQGALEARIIGPGGSTVPVKLEKVDGTTTYEGKYDPIKEGRHVVMISYGGHEVPGSPFQVGVGPSRNTGVRVFGPGLSGGMVHQPALFVVETNGETGALGFQIEGPSQSVINCDDNGDGSANVTYLPSAPGEYFVHILCDEEDIEGSPYLATILPLTPDLEPSRLLCSGPGLDPTQPLFVGQKAEFTIDPRPAGGLAPLKVQVMDATGTPVPLQITTLPNGTSKCVYVPTKAGKHSVLVSYGGVGLSPYRVTVVQPTDSREVEVVGPGVQPGLLSATPTHFNIDASRAGHGHLALSISDQKGNSIPYSVIDNGNNTFTVEYTPSQPGTYKVRILYADTEVPGSPISVTVSPHIDLSHVEVKGLESTVFIDSPTEFAVSGLEDGRGLTCLVRSPSGDESKGAVSGGPGGTQRVLFTPTQVGTHTLELTYEGLSLGSPKRVQVQRGSDPSKVKAFGPGLERAYVNQENTFQIETKGAGSSGLNLAIEGASEAKMTCKDNRDGSCTVDYVPTAVGLYDITIKFGETDIPGSPFKVAVTHSASEEKVRVYGDGLDSKKVREGVPQSFVIDASEAGPGPMSCEIQGLKEAAVVSDRGDGTFGVSYVPRVAGAELKVVATYNGKDIPNTPVRVGVRPRVEPDRVILSGAGLSGTGVPASLPARFEIDTSDAGIGELEVGLRGPDGRPRKVALSQEGDGKYVGVYRPDHIGPYTVEVKYGGLGVGQPVPVTAYAVGQSSKCLITEGEEPVVGAGEEQCVTVQCSEAGEGALTALIQSASGKDLETEIEQNDDGTYSVYYKAKEEGDYRMKLQYGGQPVPGGTYSFRAESSYRKEEQSYETSTRTSLYGVQGRKDDYRPLELHRIVVPSTGGHLTAEVRMPSGKRDEPTIKDNRDGTVSVKYEPKQEGLHELSVKYNGHSIQGSPFAFYVDSISSGTATAYGPGLTHGVSGEPCNFTISTKGAGAGGLQLAVEGPSKAEITCHDNKDGTVSVSYLPTSPGEYKVATKFGDKHLKGSPYTAKITGEGRKRNHISVGSCSQVTFPGKVTDVDLRALNAFISAPSGLEEPCFLKRLPNGNIGISFTPREIGDHEVSVKRSGTHISNSPFKIQVAEKEVGDASKVKVSGAALKDGKTHVDNTFNVNTKDAGYGGLSLSIEGPSKADIACKDKPDGSLDISYKPTEPGFYIINLKFADHHVHPSPFTVKVTGEGSNRQRERIQRQRDAVPITEVGSECRLTFKMPGVTAFELSSTVTSPGGITEDAAINEVEDGYAVHFVPKELGVHTVSVKFHDIHIPGSPFSFTVGPLRDGGAHRVHAGGPGLERGEAGVPAEFNVWTREAGAGSLAISVEGPSKAEIDFKDRKDGSCYVSYLVSEPGEYRVGIRFNDLEIPDSPFKVYISPDTGEAKKVDVGQFPEGLVQTNKPAMFLVRKNGAKGQLDAKLVSPSGVQDDCFIDTVDFDNYSVRFMPRENGLNNIHIKFNQVHIPGSPFRVKVGKDDADPACVHAHGKGLEGIKTGTKTDFFIDTANAGAGHLAVTIDGPSKVSMDCTEVDEGYKVHYTPLCAGEYFIGVKYNGYHIVGSPFKVQCSGKEVGEKGTTKESSSVVVETVHKTATRRASLGPALPVFKSNATKVTSKGMGLKKAYLQKQNQFTINAADAGNNILYVGMLGPKGPCDEVFIKHLGHHNYQVNYLCRDRGDYIIIIKWGDDNIPGSPFRIEV